MRIAVFGCGGVGGYFGGKLAQAGEDVVFIARGEHLHAIQVGGLQVESTLGDFLVHPAAATDRPERVGHVDVILVGVKAWQVLEAARAIQPMVGPETLVVPLQNGVDAPAELAAVLGAGHVLGGLCQISARLGAPGRICHMGIQPYVAFGELDGQPSPRAAALLGVFERAGVKAAIPESIQLAMWEKLLFIAAVSGVGAVTRASLGEMRAIPETRRLLEGAMTEVAVLGRARRLPLKEDTVAKRMAFVDGLAADVMPSMQRDMLEGRPSELGSQNGAVVRMGLELGVPTPIHAFIYHALLPQELRARAGMP